MSSIIQQAISFTCIFITSYAIGQTFNETLKITAPDPNLNDEFGTAVAVSESYTIIGSPNDDDLGGRSGSVYVQSGEQLFKLNASDGAQDDRFGLSVAISGNIALVGAPYDSDAGFGTGAVYVYNLETGQELRKLTASDADGADYFGISVALDGNFALVGAYGTQDQGNFTGSVYVFNLVTGQELRILNASTPATGDLFGQSVALQGNIAVIGAPGDGLSFQNYGAAYIFNAQTGQQLHKLVASDPGDNDEFGYSVALNGNRAVIGAWLNDDAGSASGSAYIFDVPSGQQLHKLTASDASATNYFGASVAVTDSLAIIGAPLTSNTGGAYGYDLDTGAELFKLVPININAGAWAGVSVAISGSTAVIGAKFDDEIVANSGSAFLFDLAPCPADLTGDGVLDFFDVSAFLTAFGNMDASADFTNDGNFDFFDVSAFLTAFGAGCP